MTKQENRLEVIRKVMDAFEKDERYVVEYWEPSGSSPAVPKGNITLRPRYRLFLRSNNSLLAEFGEGGDVLVEYAFRDAFNEISRKIELGLAKQRNN